MKNKIKTKGEVNKTLILLVGLFFIFTFFSFNLISAFKPVTTEFTGEQNYVIEANVFDVYKTNEGACVHIYVFNKSGGNIADSTEVSCRIELTNHNGTNLMVGSPTPHEDHFEMCRPATLITEPDIFGLSIVCNDSYMYGIKTAFFEVTTNGKELNIQDTTIRIFLILFFFSLIMGYYYMNKRIDYDKWYNKILTKYENKNYIKMVLSVVGYNFIKHKVANYYLIGFPIILLLTEIITIYSINSLKLLFENLIFVYSLGVVMVALLILGQMQEFIIKMKDDVQNMSWGIEK